MLQERPKKWQKYKKQLYSEERSVSLTNILRNCITKSYESVPLHYTICPISLKRVKDFNEGTVTVKFLDENRDEMLHDTKLVNDSWGRDKSTSKIIKVR